MTVDLNSIWIGFGLGDLAFGVSRDEVRQYLGDCPDVTEELISEDPSITWNYPEFKIQAYFDAVDDFRLGTLRTQRREAVLFERRLIGLSVADIRSFLNDKGLGPAEEELVRIADRPSLYRIFFGDKNIDFWLEQDRLDAILWGPLLDEKDAR